MPSREQDAKRIFTERAAFYTTSTVHKDPRILARLVELANPRPEWNGLDVATGTGHTAFAFAPHLRHVVASDLTERMLEEARRLRREKRLENVSLCACDSHALPFRDHSFSLVSCRRAVHHFSRSGEALAEMRRVIQDDGRLIIDDRSIPEDDGVDQVMNELDRLHDESHVRNYRPSEWREMLPRHGFRIDTLETYFEHRPLTSLTTDVAPGNVALMHEILAGLDDHEREVLDYREVDGVPHTNHWFLSIAATPA